MENGTSSSRSTGLDPSETVQFGKRNGTTIVLLFSPHHVDHSIAGRTRQRGS